MELNKEILQAFPEEFKDLAYEAMKQVLKDERQEASSRIGRLIMKEYQTRRELLQAQNQVKKIEESLSKSVAKLEKVRNGDLTVLFEEKQEKPKEE